MNFDFALLIIKMTKAKDLILLLFANVIIFRLFSALSSFTCYLFTRCRYLGSHLNFKLFLRCAHLDIVYLTSLRSYLRSGTITDHFDARESTVMSYA